jgi:hypothetical protein
LDKQNIWTKRREAMCYRSCYITKEVPLIKGDIKVEREHVIQFCAKTSFYNGSTTPDLMRAVGKEPWLWEYRVIIDNIKHFIYESPKMMNMEVIPKGKTLTVNLYKEL